MKITVKQQPQVEWNYPCFGISKNGNVVLFSNSGMGTVIKNSRDNVIGYHSEKWNMTLFTPFKGKITIEQ